MSSFEFLSVFISVIVGLGMANMLTGSVRLLHRRATTRFSVAHMAWTLFVFFMMVVYWWTVVFGWREWENWSLPLFLFLLCYGISLFLLSAILYPGETPEEWDVFEHFIGMRKWFFGVELTWIALELTDTYLKDHFDDFSVPYVALMASWVVAIVWGFISTDRKVHNGIALYHLVTLLAWLFYQFRDLEWTQAVVA
jgi:hypothetical protein